MIGYGVDLDRLRGARDHARDPARVGRPEADPRDAAARAGLHRGACSASTFVVFAVEVAGLIAARPASSSAIPAPDRLGSLVLALLLGAVAFCGARASALTRADQRAEGASAVVNAIYLPMAIISGTFFSPGTFPQFLRGDRRRAAADVLHPADRAT